MKKTEYIYKIIGKKIKLRRVKLGLTTRALGEKLNMTGASVSNVENGNQRIYIHQLIGYAKALELDSLINLIPKEHKGLSSSYIDNFKDIDHQVVKWLDSSPKN